VPVQPPRWILPSPLGPLVVEIDAAWELISLGRARVEVAPRRSRPEVVDRLAGELARYWRGEPVRFTVPVARTGTAFQEQTWSALRTIPWGKTVTYGKLAEMVGSNARAVGQANSRNPVAIVTPCHRVIGKGGDLVGYAGGLDMKRALLRLERCLLF
jgi:methylated-DNA-[protein]-cysteine S-methyltransferase